MHCFANFLEYFNDDSIVRRDDLPISDLGLDLLGTASEQSFACTSLPRSSSSADSNRTRAAVIFFITGIRLALCRAAFRRVSSLCDGFIPFRLGETNFDVALGLGPAECQLNSQLPVGEPSEHLARLDMIAQTHQAILDRQSHAGTAVAAQRRSTAHNRRHNGEERPRRGGSLLGGSARTFLLCAPRQIAGSETNNKMRYTMMYSVADYELSGLANAWHSDHDGWSE